MQERVASFIEEQSLLRRGEKILVGVSGGPDSMVLLDLLRRLAPRWRLELCVAHLHHGLRAGDADLDLKFVREHCRKNGIMFRSKRTNVRALAKRERLSIEEAARKARYSFLERVAEQEGIDKVALGHHADDQVETFLMRLLRGSGGKGLGGMAPLGRVGKLTVIRPLLRTWRPEILSYAKSNRVPYRTDKSNRDPRFLRNKVRLRLAKYLEKEYNPNVKEVLRRSAEILRDEHTFLKDRVVQLFPKVARRKGSKVIISLKRFNAQPPAVRSELIKLALARLEPAATVGYRDLNAMLDLAKKRKGYKVHFIPGGLMAVSEYDRIVLMRVKGEEHGLYETPLVDGLEVRCPPYIVRFKLSVMPVEKLRRLRKKTPKLASVWSEDGDGFWPLTEHFSWDRMKGKRLMVRNRREGDRYRPLGIGGVRKIKKIMIDEKLPLRLRGSVPIIICGTDIVWPIGYRIGDSYKVIPSTRRVLQVKVEIVGKT